MAIKDDTWFYHDAMLLAGKSRPISVRSDSRLKTMFQELRFLRILGTILLLVIVPMAFASTASNGSSSFSFKTFELGRFDIPGKSCPGSTTYCWNVNAEPQIRADPAGNFYASSEYLPRTAICSNGLDLLNPQCGGTGAWKSSDNGLHYVTLPSPNSLTTGCSNAFPCTTHFSPYGGDTDLATASRKNANGFYNVSVVSLGQSTRLASRRLSTTGHGSPQKERTKFVCHPITSVPSLKFWYRAAMTE